MAFKIDHEFLLLGRPGTVFTKNYFYEWDDGLGGDSTQLFLNFMCDQPELPAEEIGGALFEIMKNYFFVGLERDPGDRFEDVLKEVNHAIQQREADLDRSLFSHLHVIPAVVNRGVLYLSQSGAAEAYLVRRRFVSVLSDGLSDPAQSNELFFNIASGELVAGDLLLFSSGRLLRYISKSDLARVLSDESSLDSAMRTLSHRVSLDLDEVLSLFAVAVGHEVLITADAQDASQGSSKKRVFPVIKWREVSDRMKLHLGRLIPQKEKSAEPQNAPLPHDVREPHDASGSPAAPQRTSVASDRLKDLLLEWREMKRDRILMALALLVILLVGGIYLVRQQGQKQQYLEELEDQLAQVETDLRTAQTTGAYDKESAKILLDEAETLALQVLNSGYLRGKATEYLTEIETQRDQLDNVTRLANPTLFVDLSLVDPSMNALGLVPMGDDLYVYEYNQLYQIILDEIQSALTIDSEEVVIDAEYDDENEALLFLTKSDRIIEYQDGQFSFVDTDDGAWHSAVDMELYNNRIYLLDPTEGQIWRYYAQRESYSGSEAYLAEGGSVVDGVSFAIDGSIYVLNEAGDLVKFLSGEQQTFTISKAPTSDLSGSTKVYTEFEMFQVFVLDPSDNRVVIYNKDSKTGNLVYSAQYVLENVGELRDIYVDKEASRIYVLDATKIYEVSY